MGERLEGLPAREMLLLLWVQILTDGYLTFFFGAALIDRSSTIVEHRISDYMGNIVSIVEQCVCVFFQPCS